MKNTNKITIEIKIETEETQKAEVKNIISIIKHRTSLPVILTNKLHNKELVVDDGAIITTFGTCAWVITDKRCILFSTNKKTTKTLKKIIKLIKI